MSTAGTMLDLETIFDPDREATMHRFAPVPSAVAVPADLPLEWHIAWDERAAIIEYDGGLPREEAEARALVEILRLIIVRDSAQGNVIPRTHKHPNGNR
jgi:hypothetical protein